MIPGLPYQIILFHSLDANENTEVPAYCPDGYTRHDSFTEQ